MKRIIILIVFLPLAVYGMAQTVGASDRTAYTMRTYGVGKQQAEAYEGIRTRLQSESEALKGKSISSGQFVLAQRQLYQKYGDEINALFYGGEDRRWSYCNQHLERYQMLCDHWLVPYETMRSLREIEVAHEKMRAQIRSGSQTELEKIRKSKELRNKTERDIQKLLGTDAGKWYLENKELYLEALKNMDRYKASFHDAHAIATAENGFRKKKRAILNSGKPNAEKELDLMELEDEKSAAIISAIPSEIYARWHKINTSLLDHNLSTNYGLTPPQVKLFRNAYSKYAIGEYKILNAGKMGKAEKYAQLKSLSGEFCNSVSPLFQPGQYTKWQGWWQYCFERKMKTKGLK